MWERKLHFLLLATTILMFSILGSAAVWAGSKDMVSGKRVKFEDDSVKSMRDVFMRRETESAEYREKILANSEKSIKLLKEIRDLLVQLNEQKQ